MSMMRTNVILFRIASFSIFPGHSLSTNPNDAQEILNSFGFDSAHIDTPMAEVSNLDEDKRGKPSLLKCTIICYLKRIFRTEKGTFTWVCGIRRTPDFDLKLLQMLTMQGCHDNTEIKTN
ncbi:hypothetical protein Tco_0343228 [Tanacetum coccineum]